MLCGNAVNSVTVEACNGSSCVNVTGIMNDDVRRVMVTFTNLEEMTGSTQPQYMYSIMEEWYSSHNQWRSVSDI